MNKRLKNLQFLVYILFTFLTVRISAQSVIKNGVTLVNSGGGATACVANGYKLVGTAISNGGCVSLTQNGFDAGGMWICDPITLNQSFKVYFQANFDSFNSGDGIAFVLQAEGVPNVLGGEGGGIGYSYGNLGGCLPAGNCVIDPSVVVEFDIWNNSADPWNTSVPALGNINDLSCDHAAILVDGNQTVSGTLAGPNCLVPPNGMVTDGQFHDVCIIWDVASLQYTVYFDSALVTTYNGDIRTNFINPSSVYWGFTAGSGGANQNQRVCNVDMITNVANLSCTCVIPTASYTPTPAEICSGATTNITPLRCGTVPTWADGSTLHEWFRHFSRKHTPTRSPGNGTSRFRMLFGTVSSRPISLQVLTSGKLPSNNTWMMWRITSAESITPISQSLPSSRSIR